MDALTIYDFIVVSGVLGIWAFIVLPSLFALNRAINAWKARVLDSQHKAEALVTTETSKLRAAQHRSAEFLPTAAEGNVHG